MVQQRRCSKGRTRAIEFDPNGPAATDYYLVEGNEERYFHLKRISDK